MLWGAVSFLRTLLICNCYKLLPLKGTKHYLRILGAALQFHILIWREKDGVISIFKRQVRDAKYSFKSCKHVFSVCVCVRAQVHVFMYKCMCVHVHIEDKGKPCPLFLSYYPYCIFDTGFLTNLELSPDLREPPDSTFPVVESQQAFFLLLLFLLRSKLRTSFCQCCLTNFPWEQTAHMSTHSS